jgi:hypothetical protein
MERRMVFSKTIRYQKHLNEIGYKNIRVYLSEASINFVNRRSYSMYLKTVVLGPYLRYIPADNHKQEYLESALNEIEQNHFKMIWNLDYVRLNILADNII